VDGACSLTCCATAWDALVYPKKIDRYVFDLDHQFKVISSNYIISFLSLPIGQRRGVIRKKDMQDTPNVHIC
jgi:hypothetical protein